MNPAVAKNVTDQRNKSFVSVLQFMALANSLQQQTHRNEKELFSTAVADNAEIHRDAGNISSAASQFL